MGGFKIKGFRTARKMLAYQRERDRPKHKSAPNYIGDSLNIDGFDEMGKKLGFIMSPPANLEIVDLGQSKIDWMEEAVDGPLEVVPCFNTIAINARLYRVTNACWHDRGRLLNLPRNLGAQALISYAYRRQGLCAMNEGVEAPFGTMVFVVSNRRNAKTRETS